MKKFVSFCLCAFLFTSFFTVYGTGTDTSANDINITADDFDMDNITNYEFPQSDSFASGQLSTVSPICDYDNVQICTAGYVTIALKNNGTVWSWGSNSNGQLGTGNGQDSSIPVKIPGLEDISQLSVGANHCLALKSDGTVWAWGSNSKGQLGIGGSSLTVPAQIPGISNIAIIEAGYNHSLAISQSGQVWAWGDNSAGQLGRDTTATPSNVPGRVTGLADVKSIAAGYDFSLALTSDGSLYSWGGNSYGQLGIGSTTGVSTPSKVANTYKSIAAGYYHCIGITQDGKIYTWGGNEKGQLGTGDLINHNTPVLLNNLESSRSRRRI